MTHKPITNLPASIHRRLLNDARSSGRPFNELLQHYAMARFLSRLSRSRHANRFVLKGGLLINAWSAPSTRPTIDIDLLGMVDNDLTTIESIVIEVCAAETEPDGLTFVSESGSAERISEDAEYQGVRMRFEARLGPARAPMQVDIGFGDVVFPDAELIAFPAVLDFSGWTMPGYSRESVIAEKLHAMVKLGAINSRMNDFFDVWLLSQHFDFAGDILAQAVAATFEARRTIIPLQVAAFGADYGTSAEKQAQWASFRRKNRLETAQRVSATS